MMIYYYIPLLNLKETSPVDQKYGIKYFIILTAFRDPVESLLNVC